MRYDASMYAAAGAGPFNQTGAEQAYFADTMEGPTSADPSGSNMAARAAAADGPGLSPVTDAPIKSRGLMGKPAHWWILLVVVLAGFIFVSRKFGGPEKFGNIKLTLWNGVFATIFYVIMLNFLKVTFSYVKVPGLSELIAAA